MPKRKPSRADDKLRPIVRPVVSICPCSATAIKHVLEWVTFGKGTRYCPQAIYADAHYGLDRLMAAVEEAKSNH